MSTCRTVRTQRKDQHAAAMTCHYCLTPNALNYCTAVQISCVCKLICCCNGMLRSSMRRLLLFAFNSRAVLSSPTAQAPLNSGSSRLASTNPLQESGTVKGVFH